jgi:hypothetical protein
MSTRKALIAMIHIGKARLGMDEETYRAWLEKRTGKRSSAGMTFVELSGLVAELRAQGALSMPASKVIGGRGANRPTEAQWNLARYLARQIGLKDGIDGQAFASFVKRITKVENPRFLTKEAMQKVLTGLEKWHEQRAQEDVPHAARR